MVHGIPTLTKINDLAAVNELAKGDYQDLPFRYGIINGVVSDCEKYRLFVYPSVGGQMLRQSQSQRGQFVFVECSVESLDGLGIGRYKSNFDLWADEHCKVLCQADLR